MKKLSPLALSFCLTIGLAACGDEGDCPGSVGGSSLEGSYCAFDDLSFDTVRITLFESNNALDIRYGNGGAENLSTQLVVSIFGDQSLVFEPGRIPGDKLAVQAFRDGASRLSSLDIDEERSNVVLDEFSGTGNRARGEVNLLIELQNASGGRAVTLDGTFEGTVVDGDAQFGG